MNSVKFCLLWSILLILSLTSVAMCDITATLHFYSSDFSTSNYYTKIVCDLANQVTADNPGKPDLPVITYSYSLPQGMEISSISITGRSQQLLFSLNHLVYPVQTPMLSRTGEPIPPYVPPGVSYSYSLFPADSNITAIGDPVSYSCGMGIGTIQIRPIQYHIPQNELWISTEFTINIHLTTTSKAPFLLITEVHLLTKV